MRIELLGSGGYHPSTRRHTACLLLAEHGLVLDAGTGAFRLHDRVREMHAERLDVVLTHAHLDHVCGLTYLIALERDERTIETTVHARPEALATVRDSLLAPGLFPVTPVTALRELGERLEVRGAAIRAFALDHPGGSVGLRIEAGGRSLAYVTDTRRLTDRGIEAIRGVDLLIHEAYFPESQRALAEASGHCTARDAAWAADRAGADRLLLVHADPRATDARLDATVEEARRLRPDAQYARDEQVIEL